MHSIFWINNIFVTYIAFRLDVRNASTVRWIGPEFIITRSGSGYCLVVPFSFPFLRCNSFRARLSYIIYFKLPLVSPSNICKLLHLAAVPFSRAKDTSIPTLTPSDRSHIVKTLLYLSSYFDVLTSHSADLHLRKIPLRKLPYKL